MPPRRAPPPPPGPCKECGKPPPEVQFSYNQLLRGEQRECQGCVAARVAAKKRSPQQRPVASQPPQPPPPSAVAAQPAAPAIAVPDEPAAPPPPPPQPTALVLLSGDDSEQLVNVICDLWEKLERAQRQPASAVDLLSHVFSQVMRQIEDNLIGKLVSVNSAGGDGNLHGMIQMWEELGKKSKPRQLPTYNKKYKKGDLLPLYQDLFHAMGVRNALEGHVAGYMVNVYRARWYVNLLKRLWERFCEQNTEQRARLEHIKEPGAHRHSVPGQSPGAYIYCPAQCVCGLSDAGDVRCAAQPEAAYTCLTSVRIPLVYCIAACVCTVV